MYGLCLCAGHRRAGTDLLLLMVGLSQDRKGRGHRLTKYRGLPGVSQPCQDNFLQGRGEERRRPLGAGGSASCEVLRPAALGC